MKTQVYFVRHAEPDFTIKDEATRPLTQKGMEAAKRVAEVLADKGISKIYTSPYKRTIDTIKDLADSCKLEILTHDNFRERTVGAWVEDFQAFAQSQWENFDYKLEGGECLREVQARNVEALLEVLNANKGKSIAIATHGTALSTIINHFKPEYGFEDFWAIAGKMPFVLRLEFNDMSLESVEEIAL